MAAHGPTTTTMGESMYISIEAGMVLHTDGLAAVNPVAVESSLLELLTERWGLPDHAVWVHVSIQPGVLPLVSPDTWVPGIPGPGAATQAVGTPGTQPTKGGNTSNGH